MANQKLFVSKISSQCGDSFGEFRGKLINVDLFEGSSGHLGTFPSERSEIIDRVLEGSNLNSVILIYPQEIVSISLHTDRHHDGLWSGHDSFSRFDIR